MSILLLFTTSAKSSYFSSLASSKAHLFGVYCLQYIHTGSIDFFCGPASSKCSQNLGQKKIAENDVKLQNYASVKIKKTSRELQQGVSMETFCW